MFWTLDKCAKRINELEAYRYKESIAIPVLLCKEDPEGAIGAKPPLGDEWTEMRVGDRWSGSDRYLWLNTEVTIPVEWSGKTVLGYFDFGTTGGGNNSGFESLLFVNGEPYQGVDSNHREVFFPQEWAGSTLRLTFRLWSGLGGYDSSKVLEHKLETAELRVLCEAADDLYYMGTAAVQTLLQLDDSHPQRHKLQQALDGALRLIDWSKPGSKSFYRSVEEAQLWLVGSIESVPKETDVTVRCIGHTHIDVAWLWRLRHTREKSARSFSTVLRLMEQYPDYIFLQTQPQLYEYVKEDYPELYNRIAERIREGRWEAGGAMWLEADCNLTSGESLVRQLLYGIRFFKEEFGVTCRYLWLPDVFGYSWALPQILRKCGIELFMTTKISWNQYNRMPHDTFRWRGIDGSEIITHFVTTPDPYYDGGAFYYTYNGVIQAETVAGIWNSYRDKEINQHLLLSYGYGDGGGGVNRDMLELRRRLDAMPGLPRVETGRADEYFDALVERVRTSPHYVHTWDGELYLELHRGTYTSQAYNKRMNRKLELLYRRAEWLDTAAAMLTGQHADSYARLASGWKIILRNQFHDIIPGSSIRQVYEDSRQEYAEALQIGEELCREALGQLTVSKDDAWISVYNDAPWIRSGHVQIPAHIVDPSRTGRWFGPNNEPLEAQRTEEGGWLVSVTQIPSMGAAAIHFQEEVASAAFSSATSTFVYSERYLETPLYVMEWLEDGRLSRIYDKVASREVLAAGCFGNELQVFEDRPKSNHEAWDIDIYYQEKMYRVDRLRSVRLAELGSLRAVVEFEWEYQDSLIQQRMTVYADNRRIDFATVCDWQERRQLLKVAFPVAIRSTEATYDIQFGNVKRPTHWNTSWDYAKFETVGHQWADLSERGYGVSLLNDCKYGYDIKDHVMRLTLIKSANVPNPTADAGRHEFVYSLLPHQGDWFEGGTVREAWTVNAPLEAVPGRTPDFTLLSLSAEHVFLDAVKRAEDGDGWIIRMHEFAGLRGVVELTPGFPVKSWQHVNLLEEPESEKLTAPIRFSITPYEIVTVRIHP